MVEQLQAQRWQREVFLPLQQVEIQLFLHMQGRERVLSHYSQGVFLQKSFNLQVFVWSLPRVAGASLFQVSSRPPMLANRGLLLATQ